MRLFACFRTCIFRQKNPSGGEIPSETCLQKESPASPGAERLTRLAVSGYLHGDAVAGRTAEEELRDSGPRSGNHSMARDRALLRAVGGWPGTPAAVAGHW